MALKFIFYIFVLMNLRACVSGSSWEEIEKVANIPQQIWQSSWIIVVNWIAVVFGLIGNIALIAIFLKKDKSVRFNNLILTLAVFDVIYLCMEITASMAYYFDELALEQKIAKFVNVAFSLSSFTAIAISLERYCMLCRNM